MPSFLLTTGTGCHCSALELQHTGIATCAICASHWCTALHYCYICYMCTAPECFPHTCYTTVNHSHYNTLTLLHVLYLHRTALHCTIVFSSHLLHRWTTQTKTHWHCYICYICIALVYRTPLLLHVQCTIVFCSHVLHHGVPLTVQHYNIATFGTMDWLSFITGDFCLFIINPCLGDRKIGHSIPFDIKRRENKSIISPQLLQT